MAVWSIALDVIEDVRGSIAMFMFIIEEATQTAGMACYLYKKADMPEKAAELAQWIIDELLDPAIDFVDNYGYIAYPLNIAYKQFYLAAKQTMQAYLDTS